MVKKKEKKVNIKKSKSPQVWKPLNVLGDLNRLFSEDPWFSPRWGGWGYRLPQIGKTLDYDTKFVPLDLVDNGKEYKILAEMPGISKKNIEINITSNDISICGNTKTDIKKDEEGFLRRERTYSTLCRNLSFPQEVNPDKASATLNEGILEIKVAKVKASNKGRKISIK